MSDGEGSDYDVPDLPPMLPELDDLPPLRSLDSSMVNGSQAGFGFDATGGGGGDASAPVDVPKPKKIRQPVPKLDADRLCNAQRGMPHLVQDFKTIRFKGRGHEASDIRMLMRRYEHWAHRLFPKYPLRNVTEIIELSLAPKREVKMCLAQLRRAQDGQDVDVDVLEPEAVVPPLPLL